MTEYDTVYRLIIRRMYCGMIETDYAKNDQYSLNLTRLIYFTTNIYDIVEYLYIEVTDSLLPLITIVSVISRQVIQPL